MQSSRVNKDQLNQKQSAALLAAAQQPNLKQFQEKFGQTTRGVKFGIGSTSPLVTNNQINQIVTAKQSLLSTEHLSHSKKPFINLKTQQSNSSNMSVVGLRNVSSSCHTQAMSPNKVTNNAAITPSEDKLNKSTLRGQSLPITQPQQQQQQLLVVGQNTGQDIAVQIKRKSIEEEEVVHNINVQQFMLQPMVIFSNDYNNNNNFNLDIKERLTATELSQAQNSAMLIRPEMRNSKNRQDMLIQQGSTHHNGGYIHTGSVSSSMQFDKIRYQNLSKLQTTHQTEVSDKYRNTQSIPRNSNDVSMEFTVDQITQSTNSYRPQFSNANTLQKGEPIERMQNKMAQTTVFKKEEYMPHQVSQQQQQPVRTSTEFKCRYQELTWKHVPEGMIPLQVKVGPQFDQKKKSQRARVSKRSTGLNAHRAMVKQQILEAKQQASITPNIMNSSRNHQHTSGEQVNRSPPDPYNKNKNSLWMTAQKQQKCLNNSKSPKNSAGKQLLQFPNIIGSGKQKNTVAGPGFITIDATNVGVRANHQISTSQVKKQLMFGGASSIDRFPYQKDSLVSESRAKKQLLRDGMSQELPVSSLKNQRMGHKQVSKNVQSYLGTTQASSQIYQNHSNGLEQSSVLSSVHQMISGEAVMAKNKNAKLEHHQSHSIENKNNHHRQEVQNLQRTVRDDNQFEIVVGGKTEASIYFNTQHAQREEEKEFDRLFGARQGRKFRIGNSVEVNDTRTMDQVRDKIHPQLKQLCLRQFTSQREKILSNGGQNESQKLNTLRPSKHHSHFNTKQPSERGSNNGDMDDYDQNQMWPPKTTQPTNCNTLTLQANPILIEHSYDAHHQNSTVGSQNRMSMQSTFSVPTQKATENGQQRIGSSNNCAKTLPDLPLDQVLQLQANDDRSKNQTLLEDKLSKENSVQNLPKQVKLLQNDIYSAQDTAKKLETEAFQKFKSLGGTFYNQKERQIITMDNNGGLHYEQKNEMLGAQHSKQGTPAVSPTYQRQVAVINDLENEQNIGNDKWEAMKNEVLRVVNKGILSNKPKPKKLVDVPEPEPELDRLLHLQVKTVKELVAKFSDEEQEFFNEELIRFSVSPEPTRYLIDQIDILLHYPDDVYSVHLCQLYKFLFKKRTEMAHDRQRMQNFDTSQMQPHFERFMRKVYDEVVFEIRKSIVNTRFQKHGGISENEAAKCLSMTRMKEKKISVEKRAAAEKNIRIVEYIKYLIGQTANNEFVLKREEFRQVHELHTKSLQLSFDQYAAKEDNTMKTVANDILEKVEMNVVIQENTMPIAALKYANDPKFTYFMKIKAQMSFALPLLAKVVNKQLSLHNYKLGTEHCTAFAETCKINQDFMSKLVLNNNGLTDSDLATLLLGMRKLDAISVIDLRKNQVGQKSVALMSDFMVRGFPQHLQVLRIVDCKMGQPATYMLLRLLRQQSNLRTLSLVHATWDQKNENELVEYLSENASLKELDLSWNSMRQRTYVKILQSLVENNNLLMLNLSHNVLIQDPKVFSSKNTEEAKAIQQNKMAKYGVQQREDMIKNQQIKKDARPDARPSSVFSASSRGSAFGGSNRSNMPRVLSVDVSSRFLPTTSPLAQRKQTLGGELLGHKQLSRNTSNTSIASVRSESKGAYKKTIDERRAKKVLMANKYVTDSSELNQLIAVLLTEVMKKNRKLQHLDLSSTNLPSQVIIFLCERLRKSRSILSVHFSDNPGLEEENMETTIFQLLKCKEKPGPQIKLQVNKLDYEDANLMERLQRQLQNEDIQEGEQFLARDTIKLRQIMQQKRIEQKAIDFPKDPESKQMVLTRVIGFKEQMPGSGQWQQMTDSQDQCWHCDQWIYSLVFWDAQTIARHAKKSVHHKVLNQMVKKVEALNPQFNDRTSFVSLNVYDEDESSAQNSLASSQNNKPMQPSKYSPLGQQKKNGKNKNPFHENNCNDDDLSDASHSESDRPLLFGSFNNWQGQEMMRLDDFVLGLAKKYGRQNQEMHEDFQVIIGLMRKQLSGGNQRRASRFTSDTLLNSQKWQVPVPAEGVRSYEELTEAQQKLYDRVVKSRQSRILEDWKGIIEQYLEYRKPNLIDGYQLKLPQYQGHCPELYVLPVFMPAGKHTYLVKDMDTYEYTMHGTICDFRTEDPPVLLKELKNKVNERIFRKEGSVFEPWKEDTELSLQLACESDMSNCKLVKVIRDPIHLTATYDVIFHNFSNLKLLYKHEASQSHYPFISYDKLITFVLHFGLCDQKFKMSKVAIMFAAANSKPQKGQLKHGLCRAEFIEVLVRIAIAKYIDTKICARPAEALNKLLQENILKDWYPTPTWQDFRSRYLWTLDVNDVMLHNITGLQKLYNRSQTIHKTWLERDECQYIFTIETGLLVEYVFKVCYGFSKMTIADELHNGQNHLRMQFVEFLECIGRVAAAYWEHNKEHLQEVSLAKKIEFILDQLLPLVGQKRNEVHFDVDSESNTDEDY